MNLNKKKAAVDRHSAIAYDSKEAFLIALAGEKDKADMPKYSQAEAEEIWADMEAVKAAAAGAAPTAAAGEAPTPAATGEKAPEPTPEVLDPRKTLRTFSRYKVAEVHDSIVIPGEGKRRILKGWTKVGECLQKTSITQAHADALNEQISNSGQYFYNPEELEQPFIDATRFY